MAGDGLEVEADRKLQATEFPPLCLTEHSGPLQKKSSMHSMVRPMIIQHNINIDSV
jgi:hypothetical protein